MELASSIFYSVRAFLYPQARLPPPLFASGLSLIPFTMKYFLRVHHVEFYVLSSPFHCTKVLLYDQSCCCTAMACSLGASRTDRAYHSISSEPASLVDIMCDKCEGWSHNTPDFILPERYKPSPPLYLQTWCHS